MESFFQHTFKIKEGLGARLRASREAIGLSQKNMASAGGVTRFTQAGYESEATEPNTGYLRAVQTTGVDLHFILTGINEVSKDAGQVSPAEIDWTRLRAAHENVEFFCQHVAPDCPARYRWMLIAQLYSHPVKLGEGKDAAQSNRDHMKLLSGFLSSYV